MQRATPPPWLWFKRASDATQIALEFGPTHQKDAAPVAAYWRLREEEGGRDRWEKITYEEYMRMRKGQQPF